MRKLNTADVFAAARIVKEAGLKDSLLDIMQDIDRKKASEKEVDFLEVGFEGFFAILETVSTKNMEQKLYEFLSGPFEIEPAQVGALELEELFEMLKELNEVSNLANFISGLSKLMQTKPLTP